MRSKPTIVASLAALALVIASVSSTRAHKPITSKYFYTTDVFPIFRDRCGACHQPDGVGPMSLLTYNDARPWAQSIKDEVINLRMPPRYAEQGFGSVRNGHGLTAREIDTIVEWANGGTPQGPRVPDAPGDGGHAPAVSAKPDLKLELPEVTLAKDVAQETKTFTIATGLTADRFVRHLEIEPGAPSIVRSVVISSPAGVLAAWQPGQDALTSDRDTAYRLPAKSPLSVRIRYKKTWKQEGQAVADRTTIKLWLTDKRPARVIERLEIVNGADSLKQGVRLVAVVPQIPLTLDSVRVEAVRPDGSRQKLLLLTHPSPDWPARYWFAQPVALPAGSRIEIVSSPSQSSSGRVSLQLEYTQPS